MYCFVCTVHHEAYTLNIFKLVLFRLKDVTNWWSHVPDGTVPAQRIRAAAQEKL